jgi:hypothetical protein
VFKESGIDFQICHLNNSYSSLYEKILYRLPFFNIKKHWIGYITKHDYEIVYIRKPYIFNASFIYLLKHLKCNKKVRVILELPTYPYRKEYSWKLLNLSLLISDFYYSRKLSKYIDRISIQNTIDRVFDIKTVHFKNGLDYSLIKTNKHPNNYSSEIHLCAVANMTKWQGYERVIKSISTINSQTCKKIVFHLVGEGDQLMFYKTLTNELSLEQNVVFHGFLSGRDLDDVYDLCQLGVDAFGRHKTNSKISTSLKSREYLAKGLPVLTTTINDIDQSLSDFTISISNDNELIDFNSIIAYLDTLHQKYSNDNLSQVIREESKKIYDIYYCYNEIIEYILEEGTL